MVDEDVAAGSAPVEGSAVRGTARARLQEAARALMAGVTLDDVTAFVTARRLSQQAGVSAGAVYSAFEPDAGAGPRTRTAAQVAAREEFFSLSFASDEVADLLKAVVVDFFEDRRSDGSARSVEDLAELLTAPLVAAARGEDVEAGWTFTNTYLGAAVALNDPPAAEQIRRHLEGYDRGYVAAIEATLEATGRRLVEGLDVEQFTQMINIAADGCALRFRVDPDAQPAMLHRMYVAIIDAMTRRVGTRDDLPGHRLVIDGTVPLEDDELAAVRKAVLRVNSRAGWPAVTLAKVGQLARVEDWRLAGEFPSRHAMAGIVWGDVVAGIERRSAAHAGRPATERLAAFIQDLTDTACSSRQLLASLLVAGLQRTADDGVQATDPATARLVSQLAGLIDEVRVELDRRAPLRASLPADDDEGRRRMAVTMVDLVLLRATDSSQAGEEMSGRILAWLAAAGADVR